MVIILFWEGYLCAEGAIFDRFKLKVERTEAFVFRIVIVCLDLRASLCLSRIFETEDDRAWSG